MRQCFVARFIAGKCRARGLAWRALQDAALITFSSDWADVVVEGSALDAADGDLQTCEGRM